MPAAPIPRQNYSTGSSAPFQLNSKPNSSPQRTLQSYTSKKASHPGWEIMLLGPTMDTLEARADCRPNELALTRGRERTVQDGPCTLLHGPIGRFLYRPPTEHCYDKPIKNLPMEPWSKVHGLSWTVRSLPLVRVNSLARQSARASNVSTVGPNSMISRPGWLAFFDLQLCSVRCGDEFGLEFNWKGALDPDLTRKAITRLKGFGSRWKARGQ